MNKQKFNVYIDDIEEYTEKGKFVRNIVYFGIDKGSDILLEGFVEMFYQDEDTSEYIRDIKRSLREPTSIKKSGEHYVKVYNKDYGDLTFSVFDEGMTIEKVKELLKEIGKEI
jgi:hypothetical protein